MASDYEEYAFILPDGSIAYEIVERAEAASQMMRFKRMHGATAAMPLSIFEQREAKRVAAQTKED